MRTKPKKRKIRKTKARLGLPDLDQSKAAVIGSLRSPESQRGYRHAIDEFIEWYCSEPRLSFNRTVVLRYRIHLESRNLAPGTINVRLAAVRRLAYEAADAGRKTAYGSIGRSARAKSVNLRFADLPGVEAPMGKYCGVCGKPPDRDEPHTESLAELADLLTNRLLRFLYR